MARPEGPSCNSHDRKVVVTVLEILRGPKDRHVGPSGLIVRFGGCNRDLTVAAIT